MPPRWDSTWDGRNKRRGDFGKFDRFPGKRGFAPYPIIYYSLPYYLPYTAVYSVPDESSASGYPEQPMPAPSGYESVPPEAPSTAPTTESAPALPTVLVFKDHTIVLVRDYWLEGDRLWYETADGARASVLLGQLDLPLTQQLNRERNVRFVLESRP